MRIRGSTAVEAEPRKAYLPYQLEHRGAEAEAIVRAVLTELREVSQEAVAAASVDFLRDVTDPWDCMPAEMDEAFGLSPENADAWDPAEERIRPRAKRAFTAMIDHILAEPATA